MKSRIDELTKEIMKKAGLHTIITKKERETHIKACMRSIQGEAERAERQKIADQVKALIVNEVTYSETLYKAIINGPTKKGLKNGKHENLEV